MEDTKRAEYANITIHGRFEQMAGAHPNNIAVHHPERNLSYAELNKLSNQLAHKITEILGEGSSNVAFFMENCHYQVIAILAILKAGKAYLPLDTSFPADRNKKMLEDAGCELLITRESHAETCTEIINNRTIIYADDDFSNYPDTNPEINNDPGSLAILLYTSGSTGEPKGVMQSHRNMVQFILERLNPLAPVTPEDKIAYYLSVGFSAHALPLLMGLLHGAQLVVFNIKKDKLKGFQDYIFDHGITYVMMIPSFLRHLTATVEKRKVLKSIKTLVLGGETLYRSDVEKARKILSPATTIINIYASTETYVARAFRMDYNTPIKGNIVPIGYAVEGMEIHITKEDGTDAELKQAGKIHIRSKFFTQGYWNNPELTSKDITRDENDPETFIFHTSDRGYFIDESCIVHAGRDDSIIKLRGFRIDMAEIENILLESESVKEAACTLKTNPQGVQHIIGYIVGAKEDVDLQTIKTICTRSLPDYMVPSHLVQLEELRKNSSGKIDYKALPEPEWTEKLSDDIKKRPPTSILEKELTEIIKSSLKFEDIAANEDFLKMGADSLSLFVFLNKVEKTYKVKLSVDAIMENTSIELLAKFIEKQNNDVE